MTKAFCGLLSCLLCLFALAGCNSGKVQAAEPEDEPALVEAAAAVMSDGAKVDRWRRVNGCEDDWRLQDGTALLCVNDPTGPEAVTVLDVGSIDMLNEAARAAIVEYYERQGLLYDVQEELEKAYAEYQNCQRSGEPYEERWLHQDTAPSAFNDRIVCFLTVVRLPLGDSMCREERIGAVFDRETGEPLDNWSLFTVPPEDAIACILDAADIRDTQLRAEMQAALRPEHIILSQDCIRIQFSQGSLPSQTLDYYLSADYPDIAAVIQPWAIPDA